MQTTSYACSLACNKGDYSWVCRVKNRLGDSVKQHNLVCRVKNRLGDSVKQHNLVCRVKNRLGDSVKQHNLVCKVFTVCVAMQTP